MEDQSALQANVAARSSIQAEANGQTDLFALQHFSRNQALAAWRISQRVRRWMKLFLR